jgi:hypothetical protein
MSKSANRKPTSIDLSQSELMYEAANSTDPKRLKSIWANHPNNLDVVDTIALNKHTPLEVLEVLNMTYTPPAKATDAEIEKYLKIRENALVTFKNKLLRK